jgi:hypothetical protein
LCLSSFNAGFFKTIIERARKSFSKKERLRRVGLRGLDTRLKAQKNIFNRYQTKKLPLNKVSTWNLILSSNPQ